MEKIELYWREAGGDFVVEGKNDCPSGKKQECIFDLDLSEFDGKEMEYYFRLYDRVHNVASERNNFFVDDTSPNITVNSPQESIYLNKVLFDLDLSEKVDKLEYIDLLGPRQIFKKLCNDCRFYNKVKDFDVGNHSIIFRAVDYAGNTGTANANFVIT